MGLNIIENILRISNINSILGRNSWFEKYIEPKNLIVKRRWFDIEIREIYERINGDISKVRNEWREKFKN